MRQDLRCAYLTKVIGLTGPTGAGKSTVAHLFAQQGCYIIDCDKIARDVTDDCVDCLKDLCYAFGSDILSEQGTLNRSLLAHRAFSNQEQTQKLNRITHPYILKEIHSLIKAYQQKNAKAVVLDAPLLFEAGLQHDCDKTIAVLAPQQIRLNRVIERDHISKEQVLLRMCVQPQDEFYLSRSDIILDGCQTRQVLSEQIADLLREVW